MILHCNFEELGALKTGAEALLGGRPGEEALAAAHPEGWEEVRAIVPRLTGDITMETLADQRRVLVAVDAIVTRLKEEMDASVLATHPAEETAVSSYFLYAHSLSVLNRVTEVGQDMEALIEVMTGSPATSELAGSIRFPD
jgi:lipoate synthase